MEIIVLCKLQLVCLALTVFIALLYFSSKRVNSMLQKSFGWILAVLPLYLISDIATVITVNNINIYGKLNDFAHRIFFVLLILVVYLFCNHMNYVIEVEEGDSIHKKFIMIFSVVILVIATLYSLIAKPDYAFTDITGYATASFAGGAFAAVGIYILIIVILLIGHWKILPGKKRLAISLSLIIELMGLYFQMMHTELLLSGSVLTLMMITFYLTLENPDAVLLNEIAKEKEKADAANASKSAFISVVSHEIRTPMNAVVGMTDILLRDRDSLTPIQEKYLLNIKNSGASLVMIVNDILDQSKIEAGKMEIVPDRYELRPMIEDVKMIIENRIASKPVELIIDIDDSIPQFLIGDSLRIRQILINLMNNAVKFTEEGFIKLNIQKTGEREEDICLKFAIKDSGMGIKEEDLSKLGEAFLQADVKKNHLKEGTGLGLSISRDFINMMGGKLEVSSEYGSGSEFFFSVVQGIVTDENDDVISQAWQEADEFTAPEARILIVDDNELNLSIVEAILEPLNMQIDVTDSGENAIEMVGNTKYDIVFMDYMMPYMNGIEATENIRRMSFHDGSDDNDYFKNLPIIALTADTSKETIDNFIKAGINGFAEKPVSLNCLTDILIKWLDKEKIIIK